MARNFERKKVDAVVVEVWRLGSVVVGKARNLREHRNVIRVEHSTLGKLAAAGREQIAHGVQIATGKRHWQDGRNVGELIDVAHVFAHVVDAVPAADGGPIVPANVIREAEARAPVAGVVVVQCCGTGSSDQARNVVAIDPHGINVRLFACPGQIRVGVADVIKLVVIRAYQLPSCAEVEDK